MVLHLQQRHSILTTTYLKEVLEYRFKLRDVHLKKYVALADAAQMLGKSYMELHKRVINSANFHGVKIDTEIYVHPDCLVKAMRTKFKSLINKEISA